MRLARAFERRDPRRTFSLVPKGPLKPHSAGSVVPAPVTPARGGLFVVRAITNLPNPVGVTCRLSVVAQPLPRSPRRGLAAIVKGGFYKQATPLGFQKSPDAWACNQTFPVRIFRKM